MQTDLQDLFQHTRKAFLAQWLLGQTEGIMVTGPCPLGWLRKQRLPMHSTLLLIWRYLIHHNT
jgi:hypothetical protein